MPTLPTLSRGGFLHGRNCCGVIYGRCGGGCGGGISSISSIYFLCGRIYSGIGVLRFRVWCRIRRACFGGLTSRFRLLRLRRRPLPSRAVSTHPIRPNTSC
jgi:hypothetical protein